MTHDDREFLDYGESASDAGQATRLPGNVCEPQDTVESDPSSPQGAWLWSTATGEISVYTDGTHQVAIHWSGLIRVQKNDWLSKYSCALYHGDSSRIYEFERVEMTGQAHSFKAVEDPNLILEGELIFHGPTRGEAVYRIRQEHAHVVEARQIIEAVLLERDQEYAIECQKAKPLSERWARSYTDLWEDWTIKSGVGGAFIALVLSIPTPFLALVGHTIENAPSFGLPIPPKRPYYEEIQGMTREQVQEYIGLLEAQEQLLGNIEWALTGGEVTIKPREIEMQ